MMCLANIRTRIRHRLECGVPSCARLSTEQVDARTERFFRSQRSKAGSQDWLRGLHGANVGEVAQDFGMTKHSKKTNLEQRLWSRRHFLANWARLPSALGIP